MPASTIRNPNKFAFVFLIRRVCMHMLCQKGTHMFIFASS